MSYISNHLIFLKHLALEKEIVKRSSDNNLGKEILQNNNKSFQEQQ